MTIDYKVKDSSSQTLISLNPHLLLSNPYQPRKTIDPKSIKELADSIAQNGLLQPPIVAHNKEEDEYYIIAGERRVKAVIELGWDLMPTLLQDLPTGKEFQILGLLENLQREDLSPIDVAEGYHVLISSYGFTQEDLAKKMGKARSTVANTLRLVGCSDAVKQALRDGKISEGHALAILSVDDPELQDKILGEILFSNLNVRQTLHLANKLSGRLPQKEEDGHLVENPYTFKLQNYSKEAKFIPSQHGGGRISITFETDEELDKFMAIVPEVEA